MKNKKQNCLSVKIDYKNYTGNLTLIPLFVH